MKTLKNLLAASIILLSFGACRHKDKSTVNSHDTTETNKIKDDSAATPGDQNSVKNDSLSGDPAANGSSDPNAKLPKK